MFFRLLLESFRRQRRRKLLAGLAIFLGTTAITAMLALATTIGDRIHRELAVYGANIIMTPQAAALSVNIGGVDLHPATSNAFLHESDLAKLQTIFWHNNITGISPELSFRGKVEPSVYKNFIPVQVTGYDFPKKASDRSGAVALHPWWKVVGRWPQGDVSDEYEVVLGSKLAASLGASIGSLLYLKSDDGHYASMQQEPIGRPRVLEVVGILNSGSNTDETLLMRLSDAQDFLRLPDAVSRVEVSARTRPEDAFARKDPDTLSPKQRDLWYCRPYANSIAFQIHEAIPSARVTQLRQVEQTEGTVLSRISGLMWLVAAAALLAAAFAVSAAMATAILERRAEIGLMRSLGASRLAVATLFYVESSALALFAGLLGYLAGSALSAFLGARIFSSPNLPAPAHLATLNPVLLPIVLALALLIALAGSTPPIRSALRLDPSATLRADA